MVNAMKVPKEIRRYCPFCNEHQLIIVKQVKPKGRPQFTFNKADRHRRAKLNTGYGGSPYIKMEHGKKYNAKSSQKVVLKYTCSKCKKAHQSKNPIRTRKFELV